MDRELARKEGSELELLCCRVHSEPIGKEDGCTLGKGNALSPSHSHSHHRWHPPEIKLLMFPNSPDCWECSPKQSCLNLSET